MLTVTKKREMKFYRSLVFHRGVFKVLIKIAVQEKRNGDVLKKVQTAEVEIAGDKKLVELLEGLLENKFLKYHGNNYTIG